MSSPKMPDSDISSYRPPAACKVCGLTESEKATLANNWKKLRGTTEREFRIAGIALVLWMFDKIPGMSTRFTKFNSELSSDDLLGNEMFVRHTQNLIKYLDNMVDKVNQPEELDALFHELAKLHLDLKPPVGRRFFKELASKFHLYVERHSNLSPMSEESRVWGIFLSSLERVVQEEEAKVPKPRPPKDCCSLL